MPLKSQAQNVKAVANLVSGRPATWVDAQGILDNRAKIGLDRIPIVAVGVCD
jgi:hypothetical protein